LRQILELRNPIQPYAWGSRTAIRRLLGRPGPSAEPEAELWLGAHPKSPSQVRIDGVWRPLDEVVAADPVAILGPRQAALAPALPFLLKVLAAERPLSIQAHPDAAQARAGYARENALGLALDDAARSFRDESAKPELLYALGPEPFRVMRGLRPVAQILAYLEDLGLCGLLPGCAELRRGGEAALPGFIASYLRLEAARTAPLLEALVERAAENDGDEACAWVGRLSAAYPGDPGVIGPLVMNVFELAPGEVLFTPPGVIHAYLEGTGIELMASSDNVVRGGLTGKHVDVEALLGVVDFAATGDGRVPPAAGGVGETRFRAPSAALELSRIELAAGEVHPRAVAGVEILLATGGRGEIDPATGPAVPLPQGRAVLVPAAAGSYRLLGPGTWFRAAVPESP